MRLHPPGGTARRRLRTSALLATTLALGTGLMVATTTQANAAAGCSVTYTVNQWPGGFTGNLGVTNLGDPIDGWTLEWNFADGQTVTQSWGGAFDQNGSHVTVTNASWNAQLGTNATVTLGFNGTWTGTNSVPTSFTLNGVTCTGSTTGNPPSSPSPTPTGGQPSPTPTSDVAWSSSGQWATWNNGGYILYNDVWGSGAGPQTIWANSYHDWGVWADHPNTGGVKSYPNCTKEINQSISSLNSVTSSFDVTVPSSGAYETAYDIWANGSSYEIMLWMNKTGPVGPLGSLQTTATVGGHTWQVYSGSNGSNQVFSFVRTGNTSSGTVDILAVLNWIRDAGWFGDVTLTKVQFGYEITSSSGGLNFTTNDFSVSAS